MTPIPPHLELCVAYIALWRSRDAAAPFVAALRSADPLAGLMALLPRCRSDLLTIGVVMASSLANPGCESWCLGEVVYQLTLPDHDNDLLWVVDGDGVWRLCPIAAIPAGARRESGPPFGEVYTANDDDVSYGVVGDTFKAAEFDIHEARTISAVLLEASTTGLSAARKSALKAQQTYADGGDDAFSMIRRLSRAVEGL